MCHHDGQWHQKSCKKTPNDFFIIVIDISLLIMLGSMLMIIGSMVLVMLTLQKCVEVEHCRTFPQLEPRSRQQLAPEDCQDLEKQSFIGEDENLHEHLVDSPG